MSPGSFCRADIKHTSSRLTSVSRKPHGACFLQTTHAQGYPSPSHSIGQVLQFECNVMPFSTPRNHKTFDDIPIVDSVPRITKSREKIRIDRFSHRQLDCRPPGQ